MSTANLVLVPAPFSIDSTWTVEEFHQAMIASIAASTDSSQVVVGKIGGTAPTSNVGPWLNGTTLYTWDGSDYVPAPIKVGDADFQVTLASTPTDNRTIALPDKTGTLALTSDLERASVTPALGPTVTIDWSLSDSFAIVLNQDITIANSHSLTGQKISITIYNEPGKSYTVSWPGDTNFGVAGAPTQSTDDKTDVVWLENIAGSIYGRYLQGY